MCLAEQRCFSGSDCWLARLYEDWKGGEDQFSALLAILLFWAQCPSDGAVSGTVLCLLVIQTSWLFGQTERGRVKLWRNTIVVSQWGYQENCFGQKKTKTRVSISLWTWRASFVGNFSKNKIFNFNWMNLSNARCSWRPNNCRKTEYGSNY